MNIDQYRALKAQEASAPAPTPVVQAIPNQTPPVVEPTPIVEVKPAVPEKINIEGIGEIGIDELKNGYLRQSDYTQKTQDVARQKREVQDAVSFYEQVKANPDLIKQVASTIQVPPALDPANAKILELESKVYDMMLEKEISTLQAKYPDFEIKDVLDVADKKGLTNLEDAYFIAKSTKAQSEPISRAELEKQIREQVLREVEAERGATQTIISTNGAPAVIQDNAPKLSPAEQKVARMMFRGVADPNAEYAKWRDTDIRKK